MDAAVKEMVDHLEDLVKSALVSRPSIESSCKKVARWTRYFLERFGYYPTEKFFTEYTPEDRQGFLDDLKKKVDALDDKDLIAIWVVVGQFTEREACTPSE